jgi:AraC-like DNA-binding protein
MMAFMRQLLVPENDPPRGVSVSTHSRDYPAGFCVGLHAHASDQLVYASRGIMEVVSGASMWVVPPCFCLWIPARTPHEIRMSSQVSMRTLYLRPTIAGLKREFRVLHVGAFLRELIFAVVRAGRLRNRNRVESALRELLVAELKRASPLPTRVELPRDSRAHEVARRVLAAPATRLSLARLCQSAGVSVRTLERIFQRELGLDFESWRRQVRLMRAVELLVEGHSVKETAFLVSYQQPGAFLALFKATFATTPKAWVTDLNRRHEP